MRIVCAHESHTTKNDCKQACTCIELTSLCLHKSGSTGLFHTSSCRKHFDFLKVNVQDTVAHGQGSCSPLRSLPQSVEREYHRSASGFQVHTAYTTSTSSRSRICSYFSSAMETLHELFPRIRTALNGRLNEGFPVCSRR